MFVFFSFMNKQDSWGIQWRNADWMAYDCFSPAALQTWIGAQKVLSSYECKLFFTGWSIVAFSFLIVDQMCNSVTTRENQRRNEKPNKERALEPRSQAIPHVLMDASSSLTKISLNHFKFVALVCVQNITIAWRLLTMLNASLGRYQRDSLNVWCIDAGEGFGWNNRVTRDEQLPVERTAGFFSNSSFQRRSTFTLFSVSSRWAQYISSSLCLEIMYYLYLGIHISSYKDE